MFLPLENWTTLEDKRTSTGQYNLVFVLFVVCLFVSFFLSFFLRWGVGGYLLICLLFQLGSPFSGNPLTPLGPSTYRESETQYKLNH